MTQTSFGSGIEPVEMPTFTSDVTPVPMPVVEAPADVPPPVEMPKFDLPEGFNLMDIVDAVKAGLRHEMDAAVADVERRLAQAREIERANATGIPRETIHAEDLNIGRALIDGYTVTANSPSAGYIAWSSLHVVLLGVDYTITDGNTNKKYAWFIKPGSGTSVTLQTGDTLPVLGPNDALIWVNNGGVPVSALETSITYAVGPGVIGSAQLDTTTSQLLSTLQSNDIAQQSALDGAITTYYQNDPPWGTVAGPNASHNGDVSMGDVWYDSNDGGAYRWTGSSGTPANSWQRIADTDTSALAGLVDTKTTTYLATTASPPVAPAGGFTTGDLWMKTDKNNLLARWSGTAWVDLTLGDQAISGVSGAKVGSGISASNVTTGTLTGSLVGTGINAGNVSTGTLSGARVGAGVAPSVLTGAGTAPVGAIPQLTPAKLNTAFHMLY